LENSTHEARELIDILRCISKKIGTICFERFINKSEIEERDYASTGELVGQIYTNNDLWKSRKHSPKMKKGTISPAEVHQLDKCYVSIFRKMGYLCFERFRSPY
jgi:hypothetical protein